MATFIVSVSLGLVAKSIAAYGSTTQIQQLLIGRALTGVNAFA